MAVLDANDLKAIKDLMEVTVEEVIEKKGVVTKDYIGNLPTKDELYTKWMRLWENSKLYKPIK